MGQAIGSALGTGLGTGVGAVLDATGKTVKFLVRPFQTAKK